MNARPLVQRRLGGAARSIGTVMLGLLLAVVGAFIVVQPAAADHQTPGANGSVKIDGDPVDDSTSNEPHVPCSFDLQFFGFDPGPGTNAAVVTFNVWAPTNPNPPVVSPLPDKGRSSFDFTGGNDPSNVLNHTETYELDTTGLEPQPQQGFHIKVDVVVTEVSGKVFHKYKVFWLTPCGTEPTPEPTDTPTPEPTDTPTPEPTETPTPGPTDSPEPSDSPAPTSTPVPGPGPTAFDGGFGATAGGGAGGGLGSVALLGWVVLLAGMAVMALGGFRLLKPARQGGHDA
jgi:hypothetical protein